MRQQVIRVNRHTGGLESEQVEKAGSRLVNRHTGGLEKNANYGEGIQDVNRHTGGLEKTWLQRQNRKQVRLRGR